MHRELSLPRALGLVLALEALLLVLDIALGPWTVVGFEEARNARAAVQLACGHGDRWLELQYRDFCGGCTVEAAVGVPLVRIFGTSVAVWKLVPALFHLAVVAGAAGLAAQVAGPAGALWAGALLAAAPWAYRELALTGWGNHVESGAFTLPALWMALVARRTETAAPRALRWLAAGLLLGLGLSFCRTSAWVALPLSVLAIQGLRRGGLALVPGLLLGLLPLWWVYGGRPGALAGEQARLVGLELADPRRLLAWAGSDVLPGRLWPESGLFIDALGSLGIGAAAALGVVGLRRCWPAGLGLAALVLAWALRADLWADQSPLTDHSPFHYRYRAPAWPLLVVGMATLGTTRWRPLLGGLVVFGLGWRVAAWAGGPAPMAAGAVYQLDPTPDPTVPEGQPPVRQLRRQGRPVDLAAAVAWSAHEDALPECRAHHLVEQGRRAGLGLRHGDRADVVQWWAALAPADREAAAMGLAWGVAPPGQDIDEHAISRAHKLAGDALILPLALRLGSQRAPSPAVACAARALEAVEAATRGGRRAAPLPEPGPGCDQSAHHEAALDLARARYLGGR